jgi:hypothetical protein
VAIRGVNPGRNRVWRERQVGKGYLAGAVGPLADRHQAAGLIGVGVRGGAAEPDKVLPVAGQASMRRPWLAAYRATRLSPGAGRARRRGGRAARRTTGLEHHTPARGTLVATAVRRACGGLSWSSYAGENVDWRDALRSDEERPHPAREARAPEELLARVLSRDGSKTLATDTPDVPDVRRLFTAELRAERDRLAELRAQCPPDRSRELRLAAQRADEAEQAHQQAHTDQQAASEQAAALEGV